MDEDLKIVYLTGKVRACQMGSIPKVLEQGWFVNHTFIGSLFLHFNTKETINSTHLAKHRLLKERGIFLVKTGMFFMSAFYYRKSC